jgi:hypothetical protein
MPSEHIWLRGKSVVKSSHYNEILAPAETQRPILLCASVCYLLANSDIYALAYRLPIDHWTLTLERPMGSDLKYLLKGTILVKYYLTGIFDLS